MPVNSTHPQYKQTVGQWTRCRDAVDGQDAIKAKTTEYLPALSAHAGSMEGAAAYRAYLGRALWFGATDRTLRGYVGAIMRNEPGFVVPDVIKSRIEDITDQGQQAVEFVHTMTKELLTTGRCGLLVDKCADDPEELAYIRLYYPENILNWRFKDDVLVHLTLSERVLVDDPSDPYELMEIEQIRELFLGEKGYGVRLWHKKSDAQGERWEVVGAISPLLRGSALDFIPFVFVSSDKDAVSCSKPPILDLVDANINHFQLDADWRHGLHFTALPTAVFTGTDETKFHLGSETAISMRNENSKAYFLEFQGLGLTAIRDAMEERKAQMASLGAQLLQRGQRGRGVETAEAARIQNSGETSLLSTIVGRTEEALEKALQYILMWEGRPVEEGAIEVKLNRDFIDATLNAEDINALVAGWQAGSMPTESLFWNFQRGGVVEPKLSYEDFKKQLDAHAAELVARQRATAAPTAPSADSSSGAGSAEAANGAQGGAAGAKGRKGAVDMEDQ